MSKFFQAVVKPTITVTALNAGNIGATQILFDFAKFDVPNGSARFLGGHCLYRGKNGADYTPLDFDLYFAKTDEEGTAPFLSADRRGTVDSTLTQTGAAHLLQSRTFVDASLASNGADLIYGNIIMIEASGGASNASTSQDLVVTPILEGVPGSGSSKGYASLCVAAISKGNHNWGPSTMTVDGTMSTASPVLTVADLDARIALVPGDILRDEDDNLLGTVKSVDSATQVTLEANLANASANDKLVFNTTPITLVLGFEQ